MKREMLKVSVALSLVLASCAPQSSTDTTSTLPTQDKTTSTDLTNTSGTTIKGVDESINPDIPVAAVPSSNPFRPLSLDEKSGGSSSAAISDVGSSSRADNFVPAPPPVVSTPKISPTISSVTEKISASKPSMDSWGTSSGGFIPASTSSTSNNSSNADNVVIVPTDKPWKDSAKDFVKFDGKDKDKKLPQLAKNSGKEKSALELVLERENIQFTGAVLGPINTAIFKGDQGFMVVSEGEKIPDMDVKVKSIGTNSVTLSLDKDIAKLKLDPVQTNSQNPQ